MKYHPMFEGVPENGSYRGRVVMPDGKIALRSPRLYATASQAIEAVSMLWDSRNAAPKEVTA